MTSVDCCRVKRHRTTDLKASSVLSRALACRIVPRVTWSTLCAAELCQVATKLVEDDDGVSLEVRDDDVSVDWTDRQVFWTLNSSRTYTPDNKSAEPAMQLTIRPTPT